MTYTWRRQVFTSSNYLSSAVWLDARSAGVKYVRARFRWGFYGDTAITTDYVSVASNLSVFGLCTTIGDGTETPPNPLTHGADVDPPTQRWIYWEARAPVVTAIDNGAGVTTWRDSGATEETDVKVQVLATGLPPGDTLNLWAVWAAPAGWDASGTAALWLSMSNLTYAP